MAKDSDILITGGGLGGTALALALAQAGHSVILIDALARKCAPRCRVRRPLLRHRPGLAAVARRDRALGGGGGRSAADAGDQGHRRPRGRRSLALLHAFRPWRDRGRPDGLHGGGPPPAQRPARRHRGSAGDHASGGRDRHGTNGRHNCGASHAGLGQFAADRASGRRRRPQQRDRRSAPASPARNGPTTRPRSSARSSTRRRTTASRTSSSCRPALWRSFRSRATDPRSSGRKRPPMPRGSTLFRLIGISITCARASAAFSARSVLRAIDIAIRWASASQVP